MRDKKALQHDKRLDTIAPLCGAFSLAAGLIILLGWALDIAIMRSLLPGFAPANATVAVFMVLAGISLLAFYARSTFTWCLRISELCAVALIVLGFIAEFAYPIHSPLSLDNPWRTSLGAGTIFFVAGLGLLLGTKRFRNGILPSIWLGWVIIVMATLALVNQAITGGVTLQQGTEDSIRFVIATPIVLIVIGLGLAVPSAAQQLYRSQYDGQASPLKQRIYALLCLSLIVVFTVLLVVLLTTIANANRTDALLQAMGTERALRPVIERAETMRIESREYLTVGGGPEKIQQMLRSQSLLEGAVTHLQSRSSLDELADETQRKHFAELGRKTQLLRGNLIRLAAGNDSSEATDPSEIMALVMDIRQSAADIDSHLLTVRSSILDRAFVGARWLYFISISSFLVVLPFGYFSLRAVRQGFKANAIAAQEIVQINEGLAAEVATRTAALVKSERDHRNLLDHFPGAAYLAQFEHKFVYEYVSAGSQELFGLAPEEFTSGRVPFTDLVHPEDLPRFLEVAEDVFEGQDAEREYRIIRPDGEIRWLHAYIHPTHIVEGVAQLFEGYLVDISDRKRADIRHEVNRAVLQSLSTRDTLETTLDIVTRAVEAQCPGVLCAILLVDDSAQFLRYGSAPSLSESFCLATQGMAITSDSGCCGAAVYRRERVVVEDIATDPLCRNYARFAIAAGLRSCWSAPLPGTDGEIRGTFVLYSRDLGPPSKACIEVVEWASYFANMAIGLEHNLYDQAARAAEEKANLAKSRFLATMSHEIRTPLNGVLGMVDLMLNSAQSPSQTNQMLSDIKTSSNVLRQVVDNILEYSLGESSEQQANIETVDLPLLVHAVVKSQTLKARENAVQIRVASDPGIPARLLADGERLRQVLVNLLDNAIKFSGRQTGRNGTVELRIERRPSEVGMARIYLSISDDGIGVSPEDLQHIDQPFFQADISTTRAFDGAGLGLALTSRMLHLMDSKMEFSSAAGQGLQVGFELLLPIDTNAPLSNLIPGAKQALVETTRQSPSIDEAETTGRLILLAEDNLMNQRVIMLQLQTLGYAVHIAGNGREALAMWENRRYSLLLVDFHMPEMDGFDLARQIRLREQDTGQRTPLVGITASTVPHELELCVTVGMDDYIAKPVTLDTLVAKLARWLPFELNASAPAQHRTAPDDGCVVDWQAFGKYIGTDDPALLVEFFTDFLRSAADTLTAIDQAVRAQDAPQVAALAHRLKSSARVVGANPMSDTCQRLEQAGSGPQWVDIERECTVLQECFAVVMAEAGNRDIVL